MKVDRTDSFNDNDFLSCVASINAPLRFPGPEHGVGFVQFGLSFNVK